MNLLFNFEGREIRVVGAGDKPLFVARDICAVLGLENTSMAINALEEDEKGINEVDTLGGEQRMLCVTESGLYRMVFRSNKPNAEKFRRWVFHEVLPSLRKNGVYAISRTPSGPLAPVNVERRSVLMFLHEAMPEAALPPKMIMQFGLSCRSMAKALGVRGVLMEDPLLGEALVWPIKFLEVMARSLPTPKPALDSARSDAGAYEVSAWSSARLILSDDFNLYVTSEEMFADYQALCGETERKGIYGDVASFCRAALAACPELGERKIRRRIDGDGRLVTYSGVQLQSGRAS